MDETAWNQLWNDEELQGHVRRIARYYAGPSHREDAEAEAWAWMCRLPPGLAMADYVTTARSAIRSISHQAEVQERHEVLCGDIGDMAIYMRGMR